MFRHAFASAAVLSILWAGYALAGPVDPIGPESLDIGVDNLYLTAPNPICFTLNGDDDCLEGLTITAGGAVTDSYPGGNELDTFSGVLSGNFVDTTADDDLGPISFENPVGLEVLGRTSISDNGNDFSSEFSTFDFSGNLPGFGGATLSVDGNPLTTGQTSIEPAGGGLFQITSFFDVFVELTIPDLNGGNPVPSNQASSEFDVAATPEPGSAALALLGVVSLLAFRQTRARSEKNSRRI